jgi:hypothetical protein
MCKGTGIFAFSCPVWMWCKVGSKAGRSLTYNPHMLLRPGFSWEVLQFEEGFIRFNFIVGALRIAHKFFGVWYSRYQDSVPPKHPFYQCLASRSCRGYEKSLTSWRAVLKQSISSISDISIVYYTMIIVDVFVNSIIGGFQVLSLKKRLKLCRWIDKNGILKLKWECSNLDCSEMRLELTTGT